MDWSGIEKRVLSVMGKGFRVCSFVSDIIPGRKWWYICTNWGQSSVYLWKDGSLNGFTGYDSLVMGEPIQEQIEAMNEAPGFWRTQEEAEAFLEEWQNER